MQLKKTHDAAFFIVERIYGERPRFSYFVGTSQGGREALTVVQRYPADYDGVVSIVPIVNFTTLMLAPELIRIHEKPLANWVPPAKTAAIRAEFMRQCDGLDGLVDGVINNYMACRAIFDVTRGARGRRPWATKRCPNNVDPNAADTTAAACLTDGQISTLEMIYSPYRFPAPLAHGVTQFGMWLPTTEPAGSGLLVGARFQGQEGAAADAARHAHLGVLGVTGWMQRDLSANPLDFSEPAYAERRRQLSEWADATNPDLSAFYARGGKLISAIGAQDTLASPGAQLDYYQSVVDKMGRQKVDAFARFYVLPQGNHGLTATTATVDGAGKEIPATRLPTTWNRFALLVDWVERNTPPGKSVTMTAGDQTMVLCSYPEYPKYKSGPALQASSYSCVER
jgi:feruloyl esterase